MALKYFHWMLRFGVARPRRPHFQALRATLRETKHPLPERKIARAPDRVCRADDGTRFKDAALRDKLRHVGMVCVRPSALAAGVVEVPDFDCLVEGASDNLARVVVCPVNAIYLR